MATVELSTLPASCFPDFLVKATSDTDSIDLTNTAGTLTAALRLDGVTGPCANRAVVVPGQGLYVSPPDVALSLPNAAFADTTNPTSAEAAAAVAAAAPVNSAGMIAYLIGDGTADEPDYVWYIDCLGAATRIESPQSLALAYEIGDSPFASPDYPTPAEALVYATVVSGVDLSNGAHFYKVGRGTAQNPDYVWFVDAVGTIVEIESPGDFLSETHSTPLTSAEIVCGGLYVFDVSIGTISQSLPLTTAVPAGCKVGFKVVGNTGGTKLTILPTGADTIDGAPVYDEMKDDQKTVYMVSNGAGQWYIAYDYDPLVFAGVICDLQDGGAPQPFLTLLGSGIPIIEGAVVADLEYQIRQTNSSGTLLQQFNGAPGVAVSPSGYLVSGTYDNPTLNLEGFCGDLWVGLTVSDDRGHESNVCELLYPGFNLVDIVFTVLGDGTVTPEVAISVGGQVPVWDWGDGSPTETGQTMSHLYSGGQPIYYATATVCPTDVISVVSVADRLQGDIGSMTAWDRLINLQSVNLSNNNFGGGLPSNWGSLPLQSVYLSNNNIAGTLPASWAGIGATLQTVYLNGNSITGAGADAIPPGWSTLTGLTTLHLGDNAISGTLPSSLSAWTNLQYFNISNNAPLAGSIPASYAAWTSIQNFLAQSCSLSGPLDAGFSAWTAITAFNVAINAISGTIPASYAAWTALTDFNVENNAITGSLDAGFSAWTALTGFRVGDNLLSGTIPASYAAWTALTVFSVRDNSLTGSLDSGFGAWTALTYFDASGNSLSGAIPVTYAAWGNLSTFNVASNDLDYSASGAAVGWVQVTTVFVQGNALTSAQLDNFIPQLVTAGVPAGGTLRVDGQSPAAPLNAPACAAVTTLSGMSWTINYDAGGAC